MHDQDPIQIGHFVPHDHTVEHGGFRTVRAVEDAVFLNYLQKCHRDLSPGGGAAPGDVQSHGCAGSMVWSGQIAGDGSIPRWSASKPQAVTRRKATGVFRLPVVIRIPAGLLGSLKCDPPKGNGRRQKKKCDLESSAAGATVRIAVVVQTGCGFLSGGRRGASLEDRGRLFWKGHSGAYKSNPTHPHCLPH